MKDKVECTRKIKAYINKIFLLDETVEGKSMKIIKRA